MASADLCSHESASAALRGHMFKFILESSEPFTKERWVPISWTPDSYIQVSTQQTHLNV